MKLRINGLKLPRLRLYQQIIACFLLVVFIPLLGVSFIIYSINQKALKKELTKFTEHTAEALYQDLETEMSWQGEQLRLMRAYLLDSLRMSRQFDPAAQTALHLSETYEAVGLYNAEGQYLHVAYRNYSHLSPELRLPARLPQRLRSSTVNKPLTFSVLYSNTGDPVHNTYYLRAIMPVQQGPYAYFVVQRRFPFLQELIRNNTRSLHSSVLIVGNEGEILAGPPEVVADKQTISAQEFDFFQKIPAGVTRELSTRPSSPSANDDSDEPPTPLQKVFVKMPDIGWGIIIESPYSVRQTFVKRARDQSLMLIVACILLIFLLALFYILSINRNFRQLIKAIKAMAEGNYARRIRLITNSITPMEIVLLTGEFNRMARRMAEAWRNSQELNQELVKRNEQEAFLSGITKRLHGRLSLEEIGQLTVTDLGQYLPSGVCALVLEPYQDPEAMGPSAQSFPKQGWLWENGQFPELQTEQLLGFELGPFESTAPLLQGQPLVIQADAHPWLRVFQLGPVTLQPVVYQAQRLGYVLLAGPKTEEAFEPSLFQPVFGEEAMHMVQLVANQVGVAVHQAYQWQMIQEANKKLAKLDEFKSNLIDTVSHELRTPLTSIKGYTSRLLRYDHTLSGETRTKSLKVIKQQADRLGRLVEDLLVIPDLETANLRVFPDQVFLPELVERSVQFIQEKAQRDIQVHLPPDVVPPVMADPDRMEQILLNLLDNAVKYSLPDTTITVQLFNPEAAPLGMIRQHPRQVTLCVANQSETIPREAINSLFDKFKRLDDSTTRTTRGSGLGLFITKGLVEAMGGQIALDYRNGQFVVSVTLPLYSESTQMDQPLPVPVE